jgi:TM2 domain-containing membrane protein YozV
MADLDRAKDFINNIRLYMTMCLALIISIGSGIVKLYTNENLDYIFYLGNFLLIILLLIFIFLAKKTTSKDR